MATIFKFQAENDMEGAVEHLYSRFCPNGEMDSRTFVKLCKDCKLMNTKNFTSTDCDLIFQKAKTKSVTVAKTLNYRTFRDLIIPSIARKKAIEPERLMEVLAHSEGPKMHGVTNAAKVRLHDDKSTFTGAHTKGGPSMTSGGPVQMENLLQRQQADVRGVSSTDHVPAHHHHHHAPTNVERLTHDMTHHHIDAGVAGVSKSHGHHHEKSHPESASGSEEVNMGVEMMVHALFDSFTHSTGNEIDSRTFVKFCKDNHLINPKNYTTTDCDLIFQKIKAKTNTTSKTLNYKIFRSHILPEIAMKKSVTIDKLMVKLANSEGPLLHGVTNAANTRLHDDKNTFTGAHAQGGPSVLSGGAVQMENLLQRQGADVRGVVGKH